ncbi:MAG: trypsin-like peptidase domain-containing protein [Clostridia bacterium]|nr:trypsin-like peptidase domain-containing protein [Clostridia bacterium]
MNNNSFEKYENKWNYNDTLTVPSPETKTKNKKSHKIWGRIVTVMLVAALSVTSTILVMERLDKSESSPPILEIPVNDYSVLSSIATDKIAIDPSQTSSNALTNQQIIEKGKPSVVGIIVESEIYTFGRTFTQQSVGSGFIVTADGYIITNAHVVEDATNITVIMYDEKEYKAELIGEDTLSDVAVLKIEGTDFPAVELGNSDQLVQGDPVIAIGTPAGIEFAGTATHGMISAINRDVKITDYYGNTTKTMTVIQIDAPINSGNSGGPLFDRFGRVIGMNSLKLGNGFEGMGFSLPINGVISIANELMENGEIIERPKDDFVTGKAYLGIEFYEVTEAQAKYYGIPEGVLVYQLTPGGAALKAGIKRGDIIINFNNNEIKDSTDLTQAISDVKPGDKVIVKVDRSGEKIDIEVTMGYQS